MGDTVTVGKSPIRVDAWDKATGRTKFNSDVLSPSILYAKIVISKYAHAKIKRIDTSKASNAPGVQAIITGEYAEGILTGTFVEDRPPLATYKVRYFGEPVAIVIASSELEATRAAEMIAMKSWTTHLTSLSI
jgi:CO/xanthine dehydrogenase Mo-binding subunit